MKKGADDPGRPGMELATGRAIRAWNPARGSTVELGSGQGARIYAHDDWILSFDDGGGPYRPSPEDAPLFERGSKCWHYSCRAFVRHFEVF